MRMLKQSFPNPLVAFPVSDYFLEKRQVYPRANSLFNPNNNLLSEKVRVSGQRMAVSKVTTDSCRMIIGRIHWTVVYLCPSLLVYFRLHKRQCLLDSFARPSNGQDSGCS